MEGVEERGGGGGERRRWRKEVEAETIRTILSIG